MFMRANRVQASEVLREVRNCMFDAQYEVNSMVAREQKRIRELNEERKRAGPPLVNLNSRSKLLSYFIFTL